MPWPPPITVIGVSSTPSSSAGGDAGRHRDRGGDGLRLVREQGQAVRLQAHPGRVGTEHPQLVPADQRARVVHGDQHLDGALGAEFDPVRGDEHPHGQPPAPGTLAGSSGRVKSAVGAPPAATVTSVVRASVVEPCAVSV
jgi:hypothetical protein